MKITYISAGATSHRNDDHVAVFEHAGATDILVIDGGTSVTERDYLDRVHGDVTWFVHAFTAALEQELAPGRSQQECVHAAIDVVRARFEEMIGPGAMPLHAWPIAAMTWLRIDERDGVQRAALYSLGDCTSLLRTADGSCSDLDPFVNPQDAVLQAEIAKLRTEGVTDPELRRERMLPMLRARREFQNTQPAPTVLCLRPNGAFQARVRSLDLEPGTSLLIMTDGFYRLVDPYGRYTDGALVDACLERGLPAMLDELRTHESVAGGTGVRAVKVADDASAAVWAV
ncbi:protein phosphatase 2C domain-containing protein [Massilia timonae]|uniref:Phosphatase 2C family protein n=1 Tax=Massilia timonae TaxID=47229 RepID=A0A1S2N9R9_9BURK|nr:protein phosphatase 2C domain-containing protein [Massilia timonae]OIJ41827.1 phosphatase 2C family protein [Massilia timonae]